MKELAGRLESLAAADIAPALPDVSGSLRVLRQQMKLSEKQTVLPVVPEQQQPVDAPPEEEGAVAPGEAAS